MVFTRRVWIVCGLAACAPSHRVVYQESVFFEHCYATDLNEVRTDRQREACWTAWLAHYTRHQPAQRIDYALRRVETLQMGGVSFDAPNETSGGAQAEPSEPRDPLRSDTSLQVYASEDKPAPSGCKATCQMIRADCQAKCNEMSEACVESCVAYERVCMGACF